MEFLDKDRVDITPGARELLSYDNNPVQVINAGGDPWRGTYLDAEDRTNWNLVLVMQYNNAERFYTSTVHLVRKEEVHELLSNHVGWARYTA